MTENFLSKTVGPIKLAELADVPHSTLTNWQSRDQFEPFLKGRTEGGHRRYTVVDVLRLALAARLAAWKIAPDVAVNFADHAIGSTMALLASYKRPPLVAVLSGLRKRRMRLYRTGPRWDSDVYDEGRPPERDEHTEDFLELRVGAICALVLQRVGFEFGLIDPATGAFITADATAQQETEPIDS